MAKKYRIRVDTRKESGGGEYMGEKKYAKAGDARGVVADLVAQSATDPWIVLDDGSHIRSTDIVAVWVETLEHGTSSRKAGYTA